MKKEFAIIFISLLLIINLVSAQEVPSAFEALAKEFNVSADKIPTTPESIAQLKERFLKQQWEETINKNKVLGPIHRFFQKISVVFQILFAKPYEISLILFLTVVLWFFLATQSAKIIESFGLVKGALAFLIGLLVAIILAQIRFINLIVTFVLDISLKQENWWVRLIIIVITLGILAVGHVLSGMLSKRIEENKKKKKEKELDEKIEVVETITTEARKTS